MVKQVRKEISWIRSFVSKWFFNSYGGACRLFTTLEPHHGPRETSLNYLSLPYGWPSNLIKLAWRVEYMKCLQVSQRSRNLHIHSHVQQVAHFDIQQCHLYRDHPLHKHANVVIWRKLAWHDTFDEDHDPDQYVSTHGSIASQKQWKSKNRWFCFGKRPFVDILGDAHLGLDIFTGASNSSPW